MKSLTEWEQELQGEHLLRDVCEFCKPERPDVLIGVCADCAKEPRDGR